MPEPKICPCCGQSIKPSANQVIERYYRQRAAGGRATLKQIATETRYSYDYLRKVKRRYDAAGRWGARNA